MLSSGDINIVSCVDQSFEVCADEMRCGQKYSTEISFFEKLEQIVSETDGLHLKSVSYLEYNNLQAKMLLKADLHATDCKCKNSDYHFQIRRRDRPFDLLRRRRPVIFYEEEKRRKNF